MWSSVIKAVSLNPMLRHRGSIWDIEKWNLRDCHLCMLQYRRKLESNDSNKNEAWIWLHLKKSLHYEHQRFNYFVFSQIKMVKYNIIEYTLTAKPFLMTFSFFLDSVISILYSYLSHLTLVFFWIAAYIGDNPSDFNFLCPMYSFCAEALGWEIPLWWLRTTSKDHRVESEWL